jgi:serine/threonine-protein kinase HipA
MAMAVRGRNRHYRWQEISARHWLETARRCGLSEMKSIMDEVIVQTPKVVEQTTARLPRKFQDQIAATILTGITATAELLGEQMTKDR